MIRAAIYARYSTEHQSAASIPDQVRLCRKLCEERGWTVVDIFADAALSGATHLRPDFQRMQQAAMNGGFDILVAEALDRLSRDQEHIAGLHKRMTYLGVKIVTKSEGEINELHIGLGGTMSALFLRQLAQKTRRGLEGRVRLGKSAGGLSYGYKIDRQLRPDGTFTTGDRVIDPEEAAIVQRIFADYAQGKSARSIAIELNRDGIAPPRAGSLDAAKSWSFSTISGNWKRGTGILNNELYAGKIVWNRQNFVKDPDTGKRQARPNPPQDWVVEEVPTLRIIDEALWTKVKTRQGAYRDDILNLRDPASPAPRTEAARRNRYLLSGLLRCACCGSGYIMISASRLGCAAARNSGVCDNHKTIKREEVEERVLAGLRDQLMEPQLIAEFLAAYQQGAEEARRAEAKARTAAERKIAKVMKDIEGIVTAVTQGLYHPSMNERMAALEAERVALQAQIDALALPDAPAIHPGMSGVYARKVAALAQSLEQPEERFEAVEHLRGLIDRIILRPEEGAPGGHAIDVFGDLGAILSLCNNSLGRGLATNAKARRGSAGVLQVTVVAGAGFEPAAFRL